MAVRVVGFPVGGTKLERLLHKNQHTQRKLLNFCNGEVSKRDIHPFKNSTTRITVAGRHKKYEKERTLLISFNTQLVFVLILT